ncbi:MAG: hypothetical protein WDM92_04405 [Caulobacteraceae bacterium]
MESVSWSPVQAAYLVMVVAAMLAFIVVLAWGALYSGGRKK